jgi:glycosyltransferase involved in cell wall biosynthesis
VITQDVDGVVEECLDPARIATTIIRLLADPQRLGEISVKARQLVASRLNWAIVAETLAREIRALVPPSGDPTAGAPHG